MSRIFISPLLVAALAGIIPAQADPPAGSGEGHVHTTREGARLLPLPKEDGVWHFVIFGDRTTGPPDGVNVLRQAVADVNLLDPDLVMTVGDLVQGYNATDRWLTQMEEFKAAMSGLTRSWYPVAGNHDVYWRGALRPRTEHEEDFEKNFGPLWYWFKHKDSAFIVLFSDEGDPKTGEKSFTEPRCQQMSATQLDWLAKTLEATKGLDHVFVFLHHPRWITSIYKETNWDAVHRLLVKAGNVSAVFAGHIHRMRYDGIKEGIEYFTAGATGASFPAPIPLAGWLHHFDVVTVRKNRVSIAAVPVGTLIDPRTMTVERVKAVDPLMAWKGPETKSAPELKPDGGADCDWSFVLKNPSTDPITVTLTPRSGASRITLAPDHIHADLAAGEERGFLFHATRAALGFDEGVESATLAAGIDLMSAGVRISFPERSWEIPLHLGALEERPEPDGALELDGKDDCLTVGSSALALPDAAFTAECRVRAKALKGRHPLLSKAESSEWGLFATDATPTFFVHLDGSYAEVKAKSQLSLDEWHHVAGVFDGAELRLYVDGRLAASRKASGHRAPNAFPLMVGADPDDRAAAKDPLHGAMDEVRISTVARYAGESFEPAKRFDPDQETRLLLHLDHVIGPWCPDSGPRHSHARRQGGVNCVPLSAIGN